MAKCALIFIALACLLASAVAVAAPRSLSVMVVGADGADPSWHAVDEAVEFWNAQLAEIGAALRLGPVTRLIRSVPDPELGQLSARIGNIGAQPIPDNLARLPGDIVIALSSVDLISFGVRWTGSKGLVGL